MFFFAHLLCFRLSLYATLRDSKVCFQSHFRKWNVILLFPNSFRYNFVKLFLPEKFGNNFHWPFEFFLYMLHGIRAAGDLLNPSISVILSAQSKLIIQEQFLNMPLLLSKGKEIGLVSQKENQLVIKFFTWLLEIMLFRVVVNSLHEKKLGFFTNTKLVILALEDLCNNKKIPTSKSYFQWDFNLQLNLVFCLLS